MASTLRSDVIIPEVFTPYLEIATTLRSRLVGAGVVQASELLNASADGGDTIQVPNFISDLTGDSEVPATDDTTELALNNIGTQKQVAPVVSRAKRWGSKDMAAVAAGSEPMVAIGSKMADWIAIQEERDIFACLSGFFGSLGTNDTAAGVGLTIDGLTASTPAPITGTQILKMQGLFPESWEQFTVLIVPQAVYLDMVDRKIVDFATAQDSVNFAAAGATTDAVGGSIAPIFEDGVTQVPFFADKRVVVCNQGQQGGGEYAVYLAKPGSILMGTQRALRVETDRKPELLRDEMVASWHKAYHNFGTRYIGAARPPRATLALAASWEAAFTNPDNFGVARATVTSAF